MSQYIAPVEDTDVQEAICTVMGDNINEEMAQSILDNYVETSSILAESGCTAEEEAATIQNHLVAQFSQNKDEISLYIDEMYTDEVGL